MFCISDYSMPSFMCGRGLHLTEPVSQNRLPLFVCLFIYYFFLEINYFQIFKIIFCIRREVLMPLHRPFLHHFPPCLGPNNMNHCLILFFQNILSMNSVSHYLGSLCFFPVFHFILWIKFVLKL